MKSMSYEAVMARKNEIMQSSVGLDYSIYESGGVSFDYERLMDDVDLTLDEVLEIQLEMGVGNTPLRELKNVTALARKLAAEGKGARIMVKDEANNLSGSFKARRAAISVWDAKRKGYKGVIAATSGNYGAAVAALANRLGLKALIIQECYDSKMIGQPEILEKQRACEAYGAEVMQLTVGPELFYEHLRLLEETGYYNASLYTPYAIAGVETLGYEIAQQCREQFGAEPTVVVATNAGGGNLTGTARGLLKAGLKNTKVYAASVDLSGLSMASDRDFNKKSFTTGHTGFGVPYATYPDRSDVPRNAARPMRYIDRYLVVKEGEVFYTTEMLAALEGMERGPAGNTSLAAAFALAQTMAEDEIIVVQETEYTGAGKHPMAQLSFAEEQGIQLIVGNSDDEIPGKNIIMPDHPSRIKVRDLDMGRLHKSTLRHLIPEEGEISDSDMEYIAAEIKSTVEDAARLIKEMREEV
ncbi:MAG TPA: 2-amino-4-oxopentanoate thiolase subunit OrtB [Oscillospiraceae bacterium]|jgi:cysteine synthase|nr:2-amino-4-oxopentanoate thiolase subunit OrtB [Oscillospiraceae bacterium]